MHSAAKAISRAPYIHLSNHPIHIYIKQPLRHNTALSQSNINQKPHAHIVGILKKLLR